MKIYQSRFAVVRKTESGRGWSVVGKYSSREAALKAAAREGSGAAVVEREYVGDMTIDQDPHNQSLRDRWDSIALYRGGQAFDMGTPLVITRDTMTLLNSIPMEVAKKLPVRPLYENCTLEMDRKTCPTSHREMIYVRYFESLMGLSGRLWKLAEARGAESAIVIQRLRSEGKKRCENRAETRSVTVLLNAQSLVVGVFRTPSTYFASGILGQNDIGRNRRIAIVRTVLRVFGAINANIFIAESAGPRPRPLNGENVEGDARESGKPAEYQILKLTRQGVRLAQDWPSGDPGRKKQAHIVRSHPRLLAHERFKTPRVIWVKSHFRCLENKEASQPKWKMVKIVP